MNTFCFIRFGTKIDPNMSLTLGILSSEPIEHALKTETTVITVFKTDFDKNECMKSLKKHGHNFVLIDITKDTAEIPMSVFATIGAKPVIEKVPVFLHDNDREEYLMSKIKNDGIDTLSDDDHRFLQTRY
jgi:hypothetical protein